MVSVAPPAAVDAVYALLNLLNDPKAVAKRLGDLMKAVEDAEAATVAKAESDAVARHQVEYAAQLDARKKELDSWDATLGAAKVVQETRDRQLTSRENAVAAAEVAFVAREREVENMHAIHMARIEAREVSVKAAAVTAAERVARAEAAVERLKGVLNG